MRHVSGRARPKGFERNRQDLIANSFVGRWMIPGQDPGAGPHSTGWNGWRLCDLPGEWSVGECRRNA
jgi:hypothetical protein